MDDVLQAFRDAELEDGDFHDLFSGNDSFLTQSSEAHVFRSERAASQQVMEVKDEVNKANIMTELRPCDCEGCEDFSYSWTAVTDDDDDDYSQENDQWNERLELNEYAS
jgi:hypothetical protein